MAYSTGAGDYNALMAAVLAHAVADGWTPAAGGGWPISKGNIRGVDWSTSTQTSTDFTAGGSGATFTEVVGRIAIGTSPADATAKSTTNDSVRIMGLERVITEWHIFSDPGPGKPDYIHVVTRFAQGSWAEVFNHFSFGELDKGGMSYGGVVFAAAHARRHYVDRQPATSVEGLNSYSYNTGVGYNWCGHFSGSGQRTMVPSFNATRYRQDVTVRNLVLLIPPTDNPFPTTPGWPVPDTIFDNDNILPTVTTGDGSSVLTSGWLSTPNPAAINSGILLAAPHPYSGGVSMGSLPLIVLQNGTPNVAPSMMLGVFPGVRTCSMESFTAGAELTYGPDTWQMFPLLRQTPWNQMSVRDIVSSGLQGYAYKKVL